MALNLTTTLNNTITKSELDDNFAAIQAKFSGGIDDHDIKASAGISLAKLAGSMEYCLITLETRGDGTGLNTASSQLRDEVPFPGLDATQSIWTLKAASWVATDAGDSSTAKFDVEWGQYAADGTYSVIETLINAETLIHATGGGTAMSKQCTIGEGEVAFHASLSRVFRLTIDTALAEALNDTDTPASPSYLKVSLLLERQIQAP
ncbi:hypothetical protein CMI37_30630 [Candidatus Pacearchaeota archaeon]|nr:hypothetical protein [Candidatus Pacearchaeota archaeon]